MFLNIKLLKHIKWYHLVTALSFKEVLISQKKGLLYIANSGGIYSQVIFSLKFGVYLNLIITTVKHLIFKKISGKNG